MEKAKNFTLPSSSGKDVTLEDYRGKNIVLYFYPKDSTPGCTKQACAFKDNIEDFSSLNTVILGVSKDSMKRHHNFIEKYGLPFELLSDEEGSVCEDYGVWQLKKMAGREYMGIVRTTFLIDTEGNIVKEWQKVKVKDHIEEVLNYIKENI